MIILNEIIDKLSQEDCGLDNIDLHRLLIKFAQNVRPAQLIRNVFQSIVNPSCKLSTQLQILENGILLFTSSRWMLTYRRIKPSAVDLINSSASCYLFLNYSENAVLLPIFSVLKTENNLTLELKQNLNIGTRNICTFTNANEVADFSKFNNDAIFLYDLSNSHDIQHCFCKKSCLRLYDSIANSKYSTIKTLIKWIGEIGSITPTGKDFDTLRVFANHPFYLIRWGTIQAMANIDYELAKPYLIAAQHDENISISQMAQRVLNNEGQ
jgi:hypothetical protein